MLALILTVLTGMTAAQAAPQKETAAQPAGGKQLKVISQGAWPYAKARPEEPRQELVIRSAAELVAKTPYAMLDIQQQAAEKMATEAITKALKVDAIDWKTQMLVVVTAGARPTGGFKLDITSLTVNDKTLTVQWLLTPPKGIVTQAFTHPARVALVERFDGEVRFAAQGGKRPDAK
jgi:hypothetical protein